MIRGWVGKALSGQRLICLRCVCVCVCRMHFRSEMRVWSSTQWSDCLCMSSHRWSRRFPSACMDTHRGKSFTRMLFGEKKTVSRRMWPCVCCMSHQFFCLNWYLGEINRKAGKYGVCFKWWNFYAWFRNKCFSLPFCPWCKAWLTSVVFVHTAQG